MASLAIGLAALALFISFILPIFLLQKFLIIPIDNLISPIMSSLGHGPFLEFFQGLGPTPFTFLMIVSTLIIIEKLLSLRFNQNRLFIFLFTLFASFSCYLGVSTYFHLILSSFSLGIINVLIGTAITEFIQLKVLTPADMPFRSTLISFSCISYLATFGLVLMLHLLVKAQLVSPFLLASPFLLMLISIPVASIVARLFTMIICKIAPTSKFSKTVKKPFIHEILIVGPALLSYYAMTPHAYGIMGITVMLLNMMLLYLTAVISGLINSYLSAKIFSHHDYISHTFLAAKQYYQLVSNGRDQEAWPLFWELSADFSRTLSRLWMAVDVDPGQFNLLVYIQSLGHDQGDPLQSVHYAEPVKDTNTELGKLAEEYAGPSLTLQPEDQKNFDRIKSIIRKQERPIRSIYMMAILTIATIAAISVYLINPNLMMPNLSPLNLSSITVYQFLLALTGLFVVSTLALGYVTTSKSENIFSQTSVTNVNLVLPRKAVNNAAAIELSSPQPTQSPQAPCLSDTAEPRGGGALMP